MSTTEQLDKSDGDELVAHDDAVIARALKISLVVILFAVAVASGLIFWINRPPPQQAPVVGKNQKAEKRQTAKIDVPEVKFTDITSQAGIAFQHCTGGYGEKLL